MHEIVDLRNQCLGNYPFGKSTSGNWKCYCLENQTFNFRERKKYNFYNFDYIIVVTVNIKLMLISYRRWAYIFEPEGLRCCQGKQQPQNKFKANSDKIKSKPTQAERYLEDKPAVIHKINQEKNN